tara:strand:- start:12 stop:650 length:639 start_codon:yes stop_codon:yes gene_type:complete
MSAITETKPSHKSIATALAAAQATMGKALKSATNPHFQKKYADLASVVDACMPSLNEHGIAVIQPTTDDDHGRYVETILIHGASGETLKCRVPLIVAKNDMQGYGSAVTYARRYGLMSMSGIAPEDDDGNAAAKSRPAEHTVTPAQFIQLRDKLEEAGVDEAKLLAAYSAASLQQFPASKLQAALKKLDATIQAKASPEAERSRDLSDSIPY